MGKFDVYGGYFAPDGYFRINEGGSHEENPNGGVQVGVDENGTPNVLEEGEPVYNDFVYSDNIYADGGVLEKYHIPKKYAGKLYSKIADSYVSEAEERPNDPTSNRGLEVMLGRLADAQEEQKAIEQQKELEKELDSMSPEQLAQLEQILSEQAMEQYPDAGVPQEQMPVQMDLSPEEQQMMMDQQMPQQMPMDDQSAMMAQQGGMPVGFLGQNTRARGGNLDNPPYNPYNDPIYGYPSRMGIGGFPTKEENEAATKAAQDAMHFGAYFVPYLGNALMVYDLGSDLYRGDYDDAAIDASFLAFPWAAKGFKSLYKAGKAASKTSKAAVQVPMKAMSLGGSLYDYDENIYAPGGPIKSVLKALRKAWKVARADKEVKNAAKEFTNARKTAEQMNRSKRILDQAKLSGSAEEIVKAEDNFKYWQDQTKNAFKSSANARNAMSGRSVAGTSANAGAATAAAEGAAEGAATKTAKKTRKQLLEEANKRSEEAKKAGNNGMFSFIQKDNGFWNRMPKHNFWGTFGREMLPGHDIVRGIRRSNVLGRKGWDKTGTIAVSILPEVIKAGTGFGLYRLFAPSVGRDVNNISDAYSFVNGDLSDNVSDTSYVSPISEDRYDVYAYGGPMNTFGEGGKADDKQKRLQEIVDRVKYTGYMSESDNAYIGSLKGDVPMNIANYLRTNTKGIVPDSSFPELTYTGRGAVAYPEDNRKSIGRQIIDAITPTKETFRSIGNLISDSIPTKEEVEAAKDRAREATKNFFSGWGDIVRNSLVGSQSGYNDKEGFSLGYIPEGYGSPEVNLSFNDNPVAITTNGTNNSVSTKSVPASSGNASVNTAVYSGNNNSAPAVTTTNVKSTTVKPSVANPAVKTTAVKPATTTGIPEPEIDYNITLPEYRDPRVDLLPSIAPVSENNAARNYARDIKNMNDLQNRNDLDWYVRNRMRDRVKDRSRQDWKRIENNVKSKYKEQSKENEYKGLSTWPRYAGILGAGVQALWNAAHPADKYHIPTYNPVLPEGRMHLVDPVFNPLDENMAVNNVLNANAAALYGLANSSLGPSAGANILAADYNASKNIGNAMGSVWDMNNQRRNDVIRQRNENGQLLGNFRWGINNTRAGILNDAMLKNYQNSLLQQRLNNMAESEKYAAINSNLDAMYEGAAGIGRENFAINQINSNRALDYYLRNTRGVSGYKGRANYGKCGGTLLKKYKK